MFVQYLLCSREKERDQRETDWKQREMSDRERERKEFEEKLYKQDEGFRAERREWARESARYEMVKKQQEQGTPY